MKLRSPGTWILPVRSEIQALRLSRTKLLLKSLTKYRPRMAVPLRVMAPLVMKKKGVPIGKAMLTVASLLTVRPPRVVTELVADPCRRITAPLLHPLLLTFSLPVIRLIQLAFPEPQ